MTIALVINVFTTFFMTGLIWIIQLTHYPSFGYIDSKSWNVFHNFHTRTITTIVAPIMILELISSFALLFNLQLQSFSVSLLINFIGNLLVFVSTAFVSLPLHSKLSEKFCLHSIRSLVLTNWARTFVWTVLSFNLIWMLCQWRA